MRLLSVILIYNQTKLVALKGYTIYIIFYNLMICLCFFFCFFYREHKLISIRISIFILFFSEKKFKGVVIIRFLLHVGVLIIKKGRYFFFKYILFINSFHIFILGGNLISVSKCQINHFKNRRLILTQSNGEIEMKPVN